MSAWADPNDNPYASPQDEPPPLRITSPQRYAGQRESPMAILPLVVEGHTYELGAIVQPSSGMETYTINGYVQTRGFTWWRRHRMTIGASPPHAIEVHVNPFGSRRVYLDGALVDGFAFGELGGHYVRSGAVVLCVLLSGIVLWFGMMALQVLLHSL
jgi:hypothetical protein